MIEPIERDHARFRQIVKGRIKSDLRRYMTREEMIGKKGDSIVSIPLTHVEIPHFCFGDQGEVGVGQGQGDVGDAIGFERGEGDGEAGSGPGEHIVEVDVSLQELAEILGEELCLPRIEPKGKNQLKTERGKYTGISHTGPETLRHFKRTFQKALKREIALGLYDPGKPRVIPIKEDRRYRTWRRVEKEESNAVVVYLMDVSGSMGDVQKEIVRLTSFWIDTWLRSQYGALTTRYVIHDALARLVDRETFYHTRESGGTMISSAFQALSGLLSREFPPEEWNVYAFHFSDGDNWNDDNPRCLEILREEVLPKVNLFCYGQVRSAYGSGEFQKILDQEFEGRGNLVLAELKGKEDIYDAIRAFLGKGR